ncbi:PRA1 family protein 1 [Cavenderia fasciculata]|uniref:PRA1 family protein n=1 Tax=Cavenderia fasciculata TaxID=261658 RepID=F4QDY4_CACFS|nr:PRA1 family protein 1 [Cavenderia fasciculata]EGG13931.1 PRA1 family protein 1 [Cavenderia fasciculata]|eukprot:XP_004350639.1 PRA1 family protein 1 [Cavenderia fasciculata]
MNESQGQPTLSFPSTASLNAYASSPPLQQQPQQPMGNGGGNASYAEPTGTSSVMYSMLGAAAGSVLTQRMSGISSKVKEFKDSRLQNARDWKQFIGKREKYSLPRPSDTGSRVKENLQYFQTNYFILFFIFATYVIITKPLFLFLLLTLALITIYMNYINTELSEIQKKIAYGIQIFVSIYFLLSAGSSIVWLIGASLSIVLLHATFHVPTSTDPSTLEFGGGSEHNV